MDTILMILNQKFPPDIRVEKEIRVLRSYGYRVIVAANEEGINKGDYEIIRINNLDNLVRKIYFGLFFYSPFYLESIIKGLKKKKVDLKSINYVHVHDLKWAYTGYKVSKKINAKLILDLHENYPSALQSYHFQRFSSNNIIIKLITNFLFGFKRWSKYELNYLKKADKVIVVVKEALGRLPEDLRYKITVVSNTEDPDDWIPKPKIRATKEFIILYIGGLSQHRGIDTLIKSCKYLINDYPFIRLRIIGFKDDFYGNYLIRLVKDNKLEEYVQLVYWVPFDEVNKNIADSDLCAVPYNDTEHTQSTIPHKLFQYMAMKKPVLVSDVKPLKRVIGETNSGFIFKAGDALVSCQSQIVG